MMPLADEKSRPKRDEEKEFLVTNWTTARLKDGRTFRNTVPAEEYDAILSWLRDLPSRLARRVLQMHDINWKVPMGTFPEAHRAMWLRWREAQHTLAGWARGEDKMVAQEARSETIDWKNLIKPDEVARVFKPGTTGEGNP